MKKHNDTNITLDRLKEERDILKQLLGIDNGEA